MISDALALWEYIKKQNADVNTFRALFNWEGQIIEGDNILSVEKITVPDSQYVWYYRINSPEGYVSIPMPVNPNVYQDFAMTDGSPNQNIDYFRFVSTPISSVMSGGANNVLVNFMVFSYRPDILLGVNR